MSTDVTDWYLDLAKVYADRVREELDARWKAWPLELLRREVHEVVGALMARQCSLAIGVAENMGVWNPDLAGLVLRAMADVQLTLAWILLKPDERSRQFIHHGLGQEKLLLEHLKSKGADDEYTRSMEAWINNQRFTFLTEVNVGSWSELSLREMADEANLLDFYRLRYQPLSTAAHSMWNHVARANLRTCTNPLHRYHRVPDVKSFSPDMHYWDAAAEMLAETFTLFDEKTGVQVALESAVVVLERALEDYAQGRAETGSSSPPED